MKSLFKLIFILIVISVIVLPDNADAENRLDNTKIFKILEDTAKKVCKYSDSTLFNELKIKKEKLGEDISLLMKRKKDMEKEYDSKSTISKDNKRKLKDIEKEINGIEKETSKLNRKINSILRSVEDKYLNNGNNVTRFIGNSTIEKEDKINSNISVINGDLIVKGVISGDLALINGTLSIIDSGRIDGKIVLINSEFIPRANDTNFTMCGEVGDYQQYTQNNNFPFVYYRPGFHIPPTDFIDEGVVRYNRVEGLFFGIRDSKKYYWNDRKKSDLYGSFGYGFSSHRWTGNIGFDRWIGNENRSELGIEMHSIVDSKDNWLIDPIENSLAAFFIHEDFKDYFMREGWGIHLAQYINKFTRLRADYIEDNYRSLSRNTDWALFGGDKTFRENPAINDGRYKSVILSVNHVTTDSKQYRPEGWDVSANYEITSGQYEYNRMVFDIRRYQPLGLYHRINVRVMAGTSEKYLPMQKSFEIGGLGTIPALPFKSFSGNRMWLANIEYLMGINDFFSMIFDDDFHSGDHNDIIFFYDAGWINQVSGELGMFKGFETDNKIRQDAGVAIGFDRNTVRIGAAFRLDRSEPATFFFRISRPF